MIRNPWKDLEAAIGYRFRRKILLETALTHPSFVHETKPTTDGSNQRLEFLGDAILDMLAAEELYQMLPQADEGTLTQLRSELCKGTSLAQVGLSWQLGPQMRMGKGESQSGGKERHSNLADAVEAIIGAAYIDGGLKATRQIFEKNFLPRLRMFGGATHSSNPKGQLQEWSQSVHKISPIYSVIEESGPAHDRRYVIAVLINGLELAQGEGTSKRNAEIAAAQRALRWVAENTKGAGI